MLVDYVTVALVSFTVTLVGCYLAERWILSRTNKKNEKR